jgi:hypothetical protein
MTDFPTRAGAAALIAAIVASWPSVVAGALTNATVLALKSDWHVFVVGMILSSLLGACVGWAAWPSARRASGLWGLYGIGGALLACALWAALGEAFRPSSQPLDVVASALGILLFATPLAVVLGLIIGADVALTIGAIRDVRERRGVPWGQYLLALLVVLHFGVGAALAGYLGVWS